MPTFYFADEQHTLASGLRALLEEAHPDELVGCIHAHPLDQHMSVNAPSEAAVRAALLRLRDQIATARTQVSRRSPRTRST